MRLLREVKNQINAVESLVVKAPKEQLSGKVDTLAEKLTLLELKKKAFKEQIAELEAETKALTEELVEVAKDLNVTKLEGKSSMLVWDARKASDIDPVKLFQYLKDEGKADLFFQMVSPKLTIVEAVLGKAILTSSGLVDTTVNKYSSVKAKPKVTQ